MALRDVMGAEDALKTMECIPKPSAGSGQRHFLTEVKIRAGENMLRIKDLVRAVKRVCGLGRVDTPIIARDRSIVDDPLYAAIIDDPHGNANDCDVGHVAKIFKERVETVGASRNFPARGAPLTPDAFARSLANCLVRVIRALPQQQQDRIWRRFRNYEIYLA